MSPAILAQLRAVQEQAFTEDLKIERLGEPVFDETTGLMEESRILVWEGSGSVVTPSVDVAEADVAGRLTTVTKTRVNLPVDGTEDVRKDDLVTVVGSITVPQVVGVSLRIVGRNLGGWRTLRRFDAEEIT